MDIALLGYGKMGKMIAQAAARRGHAVVSVSDPFVSEAERGGIPDRPELADAVIEFTRPDTALANIKKIAALGKPLVVGTTGWHGHLAEARAAVEAGGGALLWSSNFSLGVNLFYRVAEFAAGLFDAFAEYDAAGWEVHHSKKADAPSGTAKTLAEKALASMSRKKKVEWNLPGGAVPAEVLHFASLRVGAVPGEHGLLFDSPADTVKIVHTARSREGFAAGAVVAAEWLAAEKRRGVFTFDDVLKDLIKEEA
jgi:4-hydroxy-tetrahydrodipicolinate reductase